MMLTRMVEVDGAAGEGEEDPLEAGEVAFGDPSIEDVVGG